MRETKAATSKKEIEALAREAAKGVKTEADVATQ
jgi:hypothetical protein